MVSMLNEGAAALVEAFLAAKGEKAEAEAARRAMEAIVSFMVLKWRLRLVENSNCETK